MRFVLFIFCLISCTAMGADLSVLREWPIEDGGRVKPIDTFARENVGAITGSSRDAMSKLLDWVDHPGAAKSEALLYVPNLALRQQLGSASDHISPQELDENSGFRVVSAELIRRKAQDKSLKLSSVEQATIDLRDRLETFEQVLGNAKLRRTIARWRAGDRAEDGPAFQRMMRVEVMYNDVSPFRITWVTYLVALLGLVIARKEPAIFITLVVAAIVIHLASFAVRCTITGFAPVTNIYETLIWVGLVSAIISLAIYWRSRQWIILLVGVLVAALATIFADAIPPQFGASIKPLPPVLRSNFYLTIHVLTIVSSYAAFALAMVLGNAILAQLARGRDVGGNIRLLDRTIQIGVVLVAAGTILGGMWADVSWGRFWGWDPKEVWALIILLTYLALLHARIARWLGDFGLALGAVAAWATVLMSWYGVNFILGVGLHSYGFGAGGEGYIGMFLLLQWIYLSAIFLIHRRRNKLATCPISASTTN